MQEKGQSRSPSTPSFKNCRKKSTVKIQGFEVRRNGIKKLSYKPKRESTYRAKQTKVSPVSTKKITKVIFLPQLTALLKLVVRLRLTVEWQSKFEVH